MEDISIDKVAVEPEMRRDSTVTSWGEKIEHDMDLDKVEKYRAEKELDKKRVDYWTNKAKEILREHGINFEKYVEKNKELVEKGEELLKQKETTGFNVDRLDIFLDETILPEPGKIVIYYNGQIDRPEHFGLLLAEMEKLGLVKEEQVRLLSKASEATWEYDVTSPTVPIKTIRRHGEDFDSPIGQSLETVVKISIPKEENDRFGEIIDYLEKTVFPNNLPGGFIDPDTRIIPDVINSEEYDLDSVSLSERYLPAVLNIFGRLVVLKELTRFQGKPTMPGWRSYDILINKKLRDYIVSYGVSE